MSSRLVSSLLVLSLSVAPLAAQTATDSPTTTGTRGFTARKSVWATKLNDPQGIVADGKGGVLIAEYGAGRIARFSSTGKLLGYVAKNLKSPAMLARSGNSVFIAERKANRVLRLAPDNSVSVVGGTIAEPLGLAIVGGRPVVVSHTQSRVFRWDGKSWQTVFAASAAGGKRYGYRCLAAEPSGAILMSDETDGQILLLSASGRLATWTKNFSSPSGIIIGADGATYVADEGDGTLSRVAPDGELSVVIDGLEKPRGLFFLNAKTLLVTNRAGSVWRVDL